MGLRAAAVALPPARAAPGWARRSPGPRRRARSSRRWHKRRAGPGNDRACTTSSSPSPRPPCADRPAGCRACGRDRHGADVLHRVDASGCAVRHRCPRYHRRACISPGLRARIARRTGSARPPRPVGRLARPLRRRRMVVHGRRRGEGVHAADRPTPAPADRWARPDRNCGAQRTVRARRRIRPVRGRRCPIPARHPLLDRRCGQRVADLVRRSRLASSRDTGSCTHVVARGLRHRPLVR